MFGFFFRGEKLSPEQHAAKLIARVQTRRPSVQIRYVAAETLLRIEEVPVRKIFARSPRPFPAGRERRQWGSGHLARIKASV